MTPNLPGSVYPKLLVTCSATCDRRKEQEEQEDVHETTLDHIVERTISSPSRNLIYLHAHHVIQERRRLWPPVCVSLHRSRGRGGGGGEVRTMDHIKKWLRKPNKVKLWLETSWFLFLSMKMFPHMCVCVFVCVCLLILELAVLSVHTCTTSHRTLITSTCPRKKFRLEIQKCSLDWTKSDPDLWPLTPDQESSVAEPTGMWPLCPAAAGSRKAADWTSAWRWCQCCGKPCPHKTWRTSSIEHQVMMSSRWPLDPKEQVKFVMLIYRFV